MKKELGDIEAEVYVLSYTEELLAVRESAYLDHVKKIEKKQGIAGFSELTNTLEKVRGGAVQQCVRFWPNLDNLPFPPKLAKYLDYVLQLELAVQ
jgi:hypothetical protein